MKKKEYMKPTLRIVLLQQRTCLLNASLTGIDSPFDYEGAGTEPGRSRELEWEE